MSARTRVGLLVACVATIVSASLTGLHAQAPAANVTAVDQRSGVVTAKIAATGQVFEFVLADRALIRSIRVGQGVFVNLGKKQVSLDGRQNQGTIVNVLPLGRAPAGGSSPSSSSSGSGSSSGSTASGTASPPPPVVISCGGTSNPLTVDTCGKVPAAPTMTGYAASCGASATISGNVDPAGSSDWLTFTVPASRANCPTPIITASISANPQSQIVFDVLASPGGPAVPDDFGNEPPAAMNVIGVTHLGGTASPIPPGTYFIRVRAVNQTVTGTWTIQIKG